MATAFDVEGHLEWIVSKDQEDDFSISLKLPSLLAELSARIFQTIFYCQFILDIVLRMTSNQLYIGAWSHYFQCPPKPLIRTFCLLGEIHQVILRKINLIHFIL